MNSKAAIAAGMIVLAGGVGAIIGLKGEGESDAGLDGAVSEPIFETPTEAQTCDKSVRSTSGRLVRVVGPVAEANAVGDSDIGRTLTVDAVTAETLCNVVVEAESVDGGIVIDPVKYGDASDPVKIGDGIYNILLSGENCKKVGDIRGFLCSAMKECLALPIEKQAKFLKVEGICSVDGGTIDCSVPVGDKRSKPDAKPFFPHSWSGRDMDLDIGKHESENSL